MDDTKSIYIKDMMYGVYGPEDCISILSKITNTSLLTPFPSHLNVMDSVYVDYILFEGDSDSMCCSVGDHVLFSFHYDQDLEGFICEVDEDSDTKLVSVKEMMAFPRFAPLVTCETCNGYRVYSVLDCPVGSASECCGGCYVDRECECEGVLFDL